MSNLEVEPQEQFLERMPLDAQIEVLEPRLVPLGGPRAMTVRRTLPQRGRSLIGPWCFIDHYGPDDVASTGGMVVPPHPHTGLQTVSWLFEGEIEHRDSTGAHAMVRPGELNLMTAGRGVQHSEVSPPGVSTLHGVQLWTFMPDRSRHVPPHFENVLPLTSNFKGATVRVFMGRLLGITSPATVYSPIVGAELTLPAASAITLPVDGAFEHGVLVDSGDLRVDGVTVPPHHLAYRGTGRDNIRFETGGAPARILLIGGEPVGEQIVMWWNFIGRTHYEIIAFRTLWQQEVIDSGRTDGHFGNVAGYDGEALPAPAMPTVRLKPRG